MADDTFTNDRSSSFVSDGDTDVQFLPTLPMTVKGQITTPLKDIMQNQGKITFNDQTVFQNVNVENYSVIQPMMTPPTSFTTVKFFSTTPRESQKLSKTSECCLFCVLH